MCSFFGTLCFPQTLHGSPKSSFARAFECLNGLAGGAGAAFTAALAADLGAGFGEAFGAASRQYLALRLIPRPRPRPALQGQEALRLRAQENREAPESGPFPTDRTAPRL